MLYLHGPFIKTTRCIVSNEIIYFEIMVCISIITLPYNPIITLKYETLP